MKQYDLETVIRRVGLGSGKWDEIQKILGYTPEDVIPFSVADILLRKFPKDSRTT